MNVQRPRPRDAVERLDAREYEGINQPLRVGHVRSWAEFEAGHNRPGPAVYNDFDLFVMNRYGVGEWLRSRFGLELFPARCEPFSLRHYMWKAFYYQDKTERTHKRDDSAALREHGVLWWLNDRFHLSEVPTGNFNDRRNAINAARASRNLRAEFERALIDAPALRHFPASPAEADAFWGERLDTPLV